MRNTFEPKKITISDTNKMPWEECFNEKIGRNMYRKMLVQDPDTGMEIRITRYPAGWTTPRHIHHCSHGMYVIEGTLKTHEGCYSPGTMVWFPEGVPAEHGATAEADVTVMFVTNKRFDIQFVNGLWDITQDPGFWDHAVLP